MRRESVRRLDELRRRAEANRERAAEALEERAREDAVRLKRFRGRRR